MRLYLNGDEYRRRREALGPRAKALAEKLKLGRTTIWKLTRPGPIPIDGMTLATFCRLCESVEVTDPETLLVVKNEKAPATPFQAPDRRARKSYASEPGRGRGRPAKKPPAKPPARPKRGRPKA